MVAEGSDAIEPVGDQLVRRRWEHLDICRGVWAMGGATDGAGGVWITVCIDPDQLTDIPQDPEDTRIQFHEFAPYAAKLTTIREVLGGQGVDMITLANAFRREETPGVPLMVKLSGAESFADPGALVMGPIAAVLLVPEGLLEDGLGHLLRKALPSGEDESQD